MSEPVAVAILAKAPIPGFAKTRLIPALGAERAALLQARLIERAVTTACAAAVGPVTLWITRHENQQGLSDLKARHAIDVDYQNDGDLGARMYAAALAARGCVLIIGTDCPALEQRHLRSAAAILHGGTDVVLIPAEDGGYVLIGTHSPHPALFSELPWGTPQVIEETRRRLKDSGLRWKEPFVLWDLDTAADIARLHAHELDALLP
jgi:rSAM/selenodomain-associated transferase 1